MVIAQDSVEKPSYERAPSHVVYPSSYFVEYVATQRQTPPPTRESRQENDEDESGPFESNIEDFQFPDDIRDRVATRLQGEDGKFGQDDLVRLRNTVNRIRNQQDSSRVGARLQAFLDTPVRRLVCIIIV